MTEGLIPPQVFEQLKPELVSPLVASTWEASNARTPAGCSKWAAAGWARCAGSAVLGVGFDPKAGFDAEDVAAQWQQICISRMLRIRPTTSRR